MVRIDVTPADSVRRAGGLTLLLSCLLLLPGCGGGGEQAASTGDPGSTDASGSDATTMAMPADGGLSGETPGAADVGMSGADAGAMPGMEGDLSAANPGMEGDYSDAAGGYGAGQAPVVPSRPAAVAMWTPQDFQNAVRERDPRLIDAIRQKVKSAPGDAAVAQLLTGLLAASLEAPRQNTGYGDSGYSGMGTMPGSPDGGSGGFIEPDVSSGGTPTFTNPGAGYPGMGPAMPMPASDTPATPPANPGGGVHLIEPGSGTPGLDPGAEQPRRVLISGHQLRPNTMETPAAVDSVSAMLLEAAVASLQLPEDTAAVPANPGSETPGAAGQETPGAVMPGTAAMPGDLSSATMPGDAGVDTSGMGYGGMPGGYAAGGAMGQMSNRQLIDAIIQGLLDNGSKEAWNTIHGMLIDKAKTPLSGPEVSELITAELFRRLDGPAGTAQTTLNAIIEGTAPMPPANRGASLRVAAAVSARATDKLLSLTIEQPRPAAADSGFPGGGYAGDPGADGGYIPPGTNDMATAGMGTMPGGLAGGDMNAAGMGMPGMENQGAGATGLTGPPLPFVNMDENMLSRAAQFLWNPALVEKITAQLQKTSDLKSAGDLLALAACIPQTSVRREIFEAFSRSHAAGANALMSTGLFQSSAHDPALLVVLKSLPRQRPPRNANQAQQTPPDSWTVASRQLVLSLRDRLRRSEASLTRYDGALPVRLHKNAIPEVSVVLTLPGPAKDFLGTAAPAETTVYYARTTFTPVSIKEQEQVAEHYEERATGQRRADPQRGVLWIDGVKTMSSGTRRTMDVIIQQAAAAASQGDFGGVSPGGDASFGGQPGGGGTSFSIEVIVVETADPKGTGAGLTTAVP